MTSYILPSEHKKTLCDEFALEAMPKLMDYITHGHISLSEKDIGQNHFDIVARESYRLADCMMKARGKK